MSVYRNLKPNVHVIKLVGGTGDGKTEIGTVPAAPKARKILLRCVGTTNSTLNERLLVYSESYTDKIVVAVKLDQAILSWGLYTEIITTALAKVVKAQGKVLASFVDKNEEELTEFLEREMALKNNTRALLTFLTAEEKKVLIKEIVDFYHNSEFHKYNYQIYNTVKNNLPDNETKENSKKFLGAIKSEVERMLEMMREDFKNLLKQAWNNVNNQLKAVFFSYFSQNDLSDDGYYFKEIHLDNPDEQFIDAMFTSNDIHNGERLSLEVMCSEIVIYLPMNEKIVKVIQSDAKANNVFRDNFGNIVFGVLDTRGLYHADNTDDENVDYFSDLLYQGDADALVMVVPLFGDSNEKKIKELYKVAFENFNKQIPVFMIHNKLDLYVDFLNKNNYSDDPLSMEMSDGDELTINEIISQVHNRESELRDELQKVQGKARKNLEIKSISCYLKRDKFMQQELVREFNILNSFDTIFKSVAVYLQESAVKIPLKVTDEGADVSVYTDKKVLIELLHDYILQSNTDKKVFSPGLADLALSIGKTPHGSGYNALRRRLRNGDGYTSNIDESYFYNCNSFSINFTANLRNFTTLDLLDSLIENTLHVNGGKFNSHNDRSRFCQIVKNSISPKTLVSILLYENAMLKAEQSAFSFKSKFQNFLQNSMVYFNISQIDEMQYVEALEQMILDAAERTLSLNVTFK